MVTPSTTKIERSGPAIRAVLRELSPDECATFEAEFRAALAETEDDFDTGRVDAVLNRWWGIAHLRANPPTEDEQATIARARQGDFTGLLAQVENGHWVTV